MSDTALTRLVAPPAPLRPSRHDDSGVARGLVIGVLLSIPLWALIGIAVAALF